MSQDQSRTPLQAATSEAHDPHDVGSASAPLAQRPPYTAFVGHQYEQLHELKRQYNKMIFEAPTIFVAVLGAGVAVWNNFGTPSNPGGILQDLWPLMGLCLGLFSLLLSYWAYRSRTLLFAIEKALAAFDEAFGSIPLAIYPFQLRKARKVQHSSALARIWGQTITQISSLQHSTVLMIVFMFVVSYIMILVSSYFLSVQLINFWHR